MDSARRRTRSVTCLRSSTTCRRALPRTQTKTDPCRSRRSHSPRGWSDLEVEGSGGVLDSGPTHTGSSPRFRSHPDFRGDPHGPRPSGLTESVLLPARSPRTLSSPGVPSNTPGLEGGPRPVSTPDDQSNYESNETTYRLRARKGTAEDRSLTSNETTVFELNWSTGQHRKSRSGSAPGPDRSNQT